MARELEIAGVDVTTLVADVLSGVLPTVNLLIDGTMYTPNGVVSLEVDGTAVIDIIHATGGVIGDVRPAEGNFILWEGAVYRIDVVGGTEYVVWQCQCSKPNFEVRSVNGVPINITAPGSYIVIEQTTQYSGTLHYKYKRETERSFGGEEIVNDRVAIVTGLQLNTAYDVVAWFVDANGNRTNDIATTVTTGA